MIRNIAILLTLIMAAVVYTLFDGHLYTGRGSVADTAPAAQESERQKAPDFAFRTLDGKTHRLGHFIGKPVVLNFWATWCAPCVIEFPAMLQLAQKTDAVFIFLSQDEGDAEIERFIRRYGKDLPLENVYIARDENKMTAQKLYQTFKLPETYLITPNQNIADKIIGLVEWDDEAMRNRINALAE